MGWCRCRGGVEGEEDETFAVVPVDLELAHVEELGVAAPAPDDGDQVPLIRASMFGWMVVRSGPVCCAPSMPSASPMAVL